MKIVFSKFSLSKKMKAFASFLYRVSTEVVCYDKKRCKKGIVFAQKAETDEADKRTCLFGRLKL